MTVVIGIDAAWTAGEPSGAALVVSEPGTTGAPGAWRVVACAPSAAALAEPDWASRPPAGHADPRALAAASRSLCGSAPDVVAVDMPLGRDPVVGRRAADDVVSRCFGAAGCSTHSPMPGRPGALAGQTRDGWSAEGVPLRTSNEGTPALLEVYPHVALLALCAATRRLPYKVSRSLRYWPGSSVRERIARLLRVQGRILEALEGALGPSGMTLPRAGDVPSLSFLKRYEDALDALVCAWVGTLYVDREARALGDDRAAIWVPAALPDGVKPAGSAGTGTAGGSRPAACGSSSRSGGRAGRRG